MIWLNVCNTSSHNTPAALHTRESVLLTEIGIYAGTVGVDARRRILAREKAAKT
jgi:hypothetical protein